MPLYACIECRHRTIMPDRGLEVHCIVCGAYHGMRRPMRVEERGELVTRWNEWNG